MEEMRINMKEIHSKDGGDFKFKILTARKFACKMRQLPDTVFVTGKR